MRRMLTSMVTCRWLLPKIRGRVPTQSAMCTYTYYRRAPNQGSGLG
ncbi:hypothetical protein CGRA01v4_01222 [Colletotrichum graminicola]|nr:hypothetical protein CGRA01v4_01222 [Colletotrichum graminicola]